MNFVLKNKLICVGGIYLNSLKKDEFIKQVSGILDGNKQCYFVTPNPEFVVYAQKDERFKKILNKADLSLPDGVGLVLASLMKYFKKIVRLPGTDMVEFIVKNTALRKRRIVFLGGLDDVAKQAAEKMRKKYGNENIFGYPSDTSLKKINEANPEIVFVGVGSPKQEFWIAENMQKVPCGKIFIGVGGAFDFISGKVKRAPKFVRMLGLEWLFRLAIQPFRWKRISRVVFIFIPIVLKDVFRK